MDKKSFLKAGHTLGPLGIGIAKDLGLSHAEKGMMVATPVLAGALLRIVMGILVDRLSPKKAAIIGQVVVIAAMAYAWQVGVHSYAEVLILGLFLGVAGASFAAALPLASRWYPAEHQGTAMGIAGAGNSGTALAALFAPGLAAAFGWVNVFGIVLIPLTIVLIAFIFMAKDAPDAPPPKTFAEYLKVLKDKDAWWFMFFYSVTFGGFVGLASSLVIYFNTQYGLDPKMAGFFTAGCVFAGSLVRPIGGNVADRIGGVKSLTVMYIFAAFFLGVVSFDLPQAWMALVAFVCAMLALILPLPAANAWAKGGWPWRCARRAGAGWPHRCQDPLAYHVGCQPPDERQDLSGKLLAVRIKDRVAACPLDPDALILDTDKPCP